MIKHFIIVLSLIITSSVIGLTISQDTSAIDRTFTISQDTYDANNPFKDIVTSNISADDYQDMPYFIRYANSLLTSCTKCSKDAPDSCQRCQQMTTEDKNRLAFIISLYAYGSSAPSTKTSDRYITNMAQAKSEITRRSYQGIATNTAVCVLFNRVDISSIMPGYTNFEQNVDFYNRQELACSTQETPSVGVENLLSQCRLNSPSCSLMLNSQAGFLGANLNLPRNLQTMYWNMLDNAMPKSQGVAYTWLALSIDERKTMDYVLTHPDNNRPITPPDTDSPKVPQSVLCDPPGGLGQLSICPAASVMQSAFEGSFQMLEDKLTFSTSTFYNESDSTYQGIKATWSTMLDIANIIMILVFLIIIGSQISRFGIKNYGIKKLLPKLIAAVILANLSYYGLQILFDVSNILGSGIYDLFKTAGVASIEQIHYLSTSELGDILQVSANSLIELLLLIFFGIIALIVLIFQTLALDLRLALAIALIVFAPIASILYILPNTEKVTKIWWRGVWIVISVFPILAVLYGSGFLAYAVSLSFAEGSHFLNNLMSRAALVLPMIFSPVIIINLVKSTPALGGALAKLTTTLNQGTGLKAAQKSYKNSELSKTHEKMASEDDNRVVTGTYQGKNIIKKVKSGIYRQTGLADSKLFAGQTSEAMGNIKKSLSSQANTMTTKTANDIINNYEAKTFDGPTQKAEQRQARGRHGGTEALLVASIALSQSGEREHSLDPQQIMIGLNKAKQSGATQLQLSQTHSLIMENLEKSGNTNAIGEVKANIDYYRQKSTTDPRKYQNYGEYDPELYNFTNSKEWEEFHKLRYDTVKQEMQTHFIEKPVNTVKEDKDIMTETGKKQVKIETVQKKVLSIENIADGTIGSEVFTDLYRTDPVFKEAVKYSWDSFSAETRNQINRLNTNWRGPNLASDSSEGNKLNK